MTTQLTLSMPATLTVLAGSASLSSLQGPGVGINVSGAGAGDTLNVQLVAGNAAALLGVSAASGATMSSHANTLSLAGTEAQINAALAGLELTEPSGPATDSLRISATDTAAVGMNGALAVDVASITGPAFVAPPQIVTLQPNALTSLPDFLLADPITSGLAAMGLGQDETLSLTLSVAQGVLLLPGLTGLSGIEATGLGTGQIELNFTANEIAALNTLLAGLEFAGPHITGGQHLDYALWNYSGVLPRVVTYGNVFLNAVGTAAANGSFGAGSQTLITGAESISGTLLVGGTLSILGNLSGGAVAVLPGAALQLPDNSLLLSGTSLDFGTLAAVDLVASGTLLAVGNPSLSGEAAFGAGARLDIQGSFTADGSAAAAYALAVSLGAGAVISGDGTLMAGNFSEAGAITGPGTLLALGGETLELDAGVVNGGAVLQVAGGGVMVLGPVAPLFGIFDTTALTIASGVTLNFQPPGAVPVGGVYAGTLGGTGGAFVINGPQAFSGTVTGFGLGDELIFPGLSNVSILNITTSSFVVAGQDSAGTTQSYTIFSTIPAGLNPTIAKDAEGDAMVVLHPSTATLSQGAIIAASSGVAQPLLGLSVDLTSGTTQSLSLTLAAGHGSLSSGGTYAGTLTLSAANITALNNELAAVNYLGTGVTEILTITSNSPVLAGLHAPATINAVGPGTVSGYSGQGVSGAEMVSFGVVAGLPVETSPLAVGGMLVAGLAEFNDVIQARGFSGTALLVDAGGDAIIAGGARVALAADITLGDANGAGTLDVLTHNFSTSGNVTLGGVAGAAGSDAAILGAMSVSGTIAVGLGAAAGLLVQGSLGAGVLTLGAGGTLTAQSTAQLSFGTISNSGAILLENGAALQAVSFAGVGLLALGGNASMDVTGVFFDGAPTAPPISIGQGATLAVGTLQAGPATLVDAGLVSAGAGGAFTGAVVMQGGTLASVGTITEAGMMSGYGVIATPSFFVGQELLVQGGRLLVTGNLASPAVIDIAPGGTLEVGGTLQYAAPYFTGAGGELVLDDPLAGFGVQQMTIGDAVDLVGIAPSLISIGTTDAGQIFNTLGAQVAAFDLPQNGTVAQTYSIVSDGAGGSLLTLDGVLPCFARGTGILTPQGYRPVESLRPNDPVITASGDRRPVRWLGWRTLDLAPDEARHARPVIIMPHAFGRGRPGKMLRLSPSHCVYIAGVLVPVTHLVNGATILRDMAAQAATYYHVELDRHDVLMAEGLECESYLDDGNRGALYQELGRRSPAKRAYAPIVTHGARLASVRRTLHDIALRAGFLPSFRPVLRAVAAGQTVLPEISRAGQGRIARFTFSAPVRALVLLSASACPADTDPACEDRRELGICLGDMKGIKLGAGWHSRATGDDGIWMGARAELAFTRAKREILLPLAAISPSWQRPAVDGRQHAL